MNLQSAAFASPGGPPIVFNVGMPIPNGFNLVDPTITAVYDTKKVPGQRYLVLLTAPVPKPPGNATSPDSGPPAPAPTAAPNYQVSRGGFYIAVPTGARLLLPPGMPIPPGWLPDTGTPTPTPPVPAAQVPAVAQQVVAVSYPGADPSQSLPSDPSTWTEVNSDDPTLPVSQGGLYVSGDGKAIDLPPGTPIPADWKPITSVVNLEPMPGGGASPQGVSIPTILKIVGVVGVAGIAYLGYLAVTNPEGARFFLSRFTELKGLVVDSSQLLIALGVIGAIGFVSYEFIGAYESEGSVAGALGKLTADVIETMVMAIVSAIEDLVKDAANWVADKVESIF